MIRNDKRIRHEFGQNNSCNSETNTFELISQQDEVWNRCLENLNQLVSKIRILYPKSQQCSQQDLKNLHQPVNPTHTIKRNVLDSTQEIAKFMLNEEELIN